MWTSLPSKRISPLSAVCVPAMHLISVDLPAPLSPTSAITSPCRTSKSTSLSAWTEPNDFVTPRSWRRGVSVKARLSYHTGGGGAPEEAPPPDPSTAYLQNFAYVPLQMSPRLRNPPVTSSFQFAFVIDCGGIR